MPVYGPYTAGTVTAAAWTADSGTKVDALATTDSNYLRHVATSPTGTIIAKNISASIAAGDVIDGIVVIITDSLDQDGILDPTDRTITLAARLTKDGTTEVGSEWSATVASEADHALGLATDLWGTTWSVAQINSANFGVIFDYTSDDPVAEPIKTNRVQFYIYTSTGVTPSPITVLGSRWRRIPDVCTDSAKRAKVSK